MLRRLTRKVISGDDRWIEDQATGLKVVKVRDHLLVYRNGVRKIWVDLELRYIAAWNIETQAEVNAFNGLLRELDLSDFYEFMRTGRVVLLNAGGHFYRSAEYGEKFGHHSGNPSPP